MTTKDKLFIVSKIKKIKINKNKGTEYLVKWTNYSHETWEPLESFPDDINTYPGYQKCVYNLYRIRKKKEKTAIDIMINNFNIKYNDK